MSSFIASAEDEDGLEGHERLILVLEQLRLDLNLYYEKENR
jgi:hypothetical protein